MTHAESTLSAAAIAAVDTDDMFADALSLPDQLRDAAWKVESAALTPWESPGGLVIAGMGGSGIGGALARAVVGEEASLPISLVRGYELPSWTTADATVLCMSYSGNTEETLACYEAAGVIGAKRVVATTGGQLAELARRDGVPVLPMAGGLQPRAALGYVFVAAVEVAGLAGVAPRRGAEIDVAASHLEQLVREWGPAGPDDSEPRRLARALSGSVPLIYGAGPTAAVAYRWKSQMNEYAKLHAFANELPELDHNELMGWSAPPRAAGSLLCSSTTPTCIRGSRRVSPRRDASSRAKPTPPSWCLHARAHRLSGASRCACWATWPRFTPRCCAGSTRRRSPVSTRSKRHWQTTRDGAARGGSPPGVRASVNTVEGLTINEAAETTGWSPRMLRYVESVGLVTPARSPAGYRLYGPAELQRLRTLRELIEEHDLGLGDLAFALRMREDAQLASQIDEWLTAGASRPEDVPDDSAWLRWEQEKHQRLLAELRTPSE